MDPHIRRYVTRSGFYGVYRVGHISLDWPLITSLVERWRDDVILRDVAMIHGLRIHGPPIIGTCDIDWSLLCYELLGVVPPPSRLEGHLYQHDGCVSDSHIYRRDFTEISHYSWGSAVLAYLYRELCRASLDSATEISGPITLLQLSNFDNVIDFVVRSWERLHVGRPDFGRPPMPIVVPHVHDDVVDGLHDHLLPNEALPVDPLGHRWRDDIDDWVTFHARYFSLGYSLRRIAAPLAITTMSFYDPYMQWYRRITRRLIAPVLHRDHMRFHSTASATELLITAVSQMAISNDLEETHRIAIDVLRAIGEDHRVHSTHEPSPSSWSSMRPPSLITLLGYHPLEVGERWSSSGHRHPSASLESPLSPPDVSIPAYSPRPETTIPSTLTLFSHLYHWMHPHLLQSLLHPHLLQSLLHLHLLQSPLHLYLFLRIAHAARLHVRVPRGHRAPRVRRVLPPSVPSISTAHVDDVSQSIEMKTFQIAQMDTTNMAIYRRCSAKRKIPSCGTH
ncbi:hypothetical protein AAG906_016998 [Vitis piasezkii]